MSDADHSFASKIPLPAPISNLREDFAMPLAVIASLVILSLITCVHFGVRALNQQSAAREQQLVRNGLALRVEEVANQIVPQTDWDDAVRHLDRNYDGTWAGSNINEFLNHTFGFDGAYVIDAYDRPVFAAIDGEITAASEYHHVGGHDQDLVGSIRKQEALRGPFRKNPGPDIISRPIQASSLKVIDGRLNVLTATLVQPDFGTVLPSGPRSPVVITQMYVDAPFLAQFSRRFLLDKVHIRLPSQPARQGQIEIPVGDEHGKLQAYLAWTPLDPGYSMLRRMAEPALIGMLLLLAIAVIELRRIFDAARKLIAENRHAMNLAIHCDLIDLPDFQETPARHLPQDRN